MVFHSHSKDHTDFEDCLAARDRLGEQKIFFLDLYSHLVHPCELQRDITGFENLVQGGRRCIRQGCMQKYSRKGFQQRIFFLVQ